MQIFRTHNLIPSSWSTLHIAVLLLLLLLLVNSETPQFYLSEFGQEEIKAKEQNIDEMAGKAHKHLNGSFPNLVKPALFEARKLTVRKSSKSPLASSPKSQ